MKKSITILPETEGAVLCLSFAGTITSADFIEFHEKPLLDIISKYDHYSLCSIYEEDFEGWSEEAADLSFKCITKISPKARRAAYVNAPDSRRLLMKMVQPLTSLEVKYFDAAQKSEAIAWVKS